MRVDTITVFFFLKENVDDPLANSSMFGWTLIGSSHFSDENIVSKFENDIKLPFQSKHKLLPENNQICKNRLINLKTSSVKDKF